MKWRAIFAKKQLDELYQEHPELLGQPIELPLPKLTEEQKEQIRLGRGKIKLKVTGKMTDKNGNEIDMGEIDPNFIFRDIQYIPK